MSSRLDFRSILLICATVATIAAFSALSWLHYREVRAERIEAARADAQQMLVVFEDHSTHLLNGADSYLRAVRGFYLRQGGGEALRRFIAEIKPSHAEAFASVLTIADSTGRIIFHSEKADSPPVNVASTEHFKSFRADPADRVFLDPTRLGLVTGTYLYRLVRPIVQDGVFAGDIVQTLRPEEISDFYKGYNLGAGGSFGMATLDQRYIVRVPLPEGNDPYGTSLQGALLWEMLKTSPTGNYIRKSVVDGVTRHYFYRQLKDYPAVIWVGVSEADIEARLAGEWANMVQRAVLFAVVASIFGLLLLLLLGKNRGLALAESLTRDKERNLADAQAVAHLGSWEYDHRRRELVWSEETYRIFGMGPGEVSASYGGFISIVHAGDRVELDRLFKQSQAEGTPFTTECRFVRQSDGAEGWIQVRCRHDIGPQGRVIRSVGTVLDVTDRKQAEQALAERGRQLEVINRELAVSNSDLEQFAYVASHDLREPLRMVSSYVTLLAKRYGETLDADGREFIAFAKEGAERMNQLILDLLDFSRIGRDAAPSGPVDLPMVVEMACHNLSATMSELGGKVEVTGELPTVFGSEGDLVRLFQNLIANALKYRDPGRAPVIRISAQRQAHMWMVAVADNGIGIEAEYFERIFGLFQRLHARDRQEGTGIGLAICKKVVERHGGRIWVASVPGEGSVFSFTLMALGGH